MNSVPHSADLNGVHVRDITPKLSTVLKPENGLPNF